jgi:hypothetical protein
MATITQIETKLGELISSVIFPNGIGNSSITGKGVKIFAGWPVSVKLDQDLLAGNSQIAIFPVGNSDKNVTKFSKIPWQTYKINTPTLIATVNSNQITITGTVTLPQGILVTLNGNYYGYHCVQGDTLNTVAAGIAALIPGATSVNNVVTIGGSITSLMAQIILEGWASREVKRQQKLFYISIFSPNPTDRSILAEAIDPILADKIYLFFDDTTSAVMKYHGINEIDAFENSLVYQRNLIYSIEYSTVIDKSFTAINQIETNVTNL